MGIAWGEDYSWDFLRVGGHALPQPLFVPFSTPYHLLREEKSLPWSVNLGLIIRSRLTWLLHFSTQEPPECRVLSAAPPGHASCWADAPSGRSGWSRGPALSAPTVFLTPFTLLHFVVSSWETVWLTYWCYCLCIIYSSQNVSSRRTSLLRLYRSLGSPPVYNSTLETLTAEWVNSQFIHNSDGEEGATQNICLAYKRRSVKWRWLGRAGVYRGGGPGVMGLWNWVGGVCLSVCFPPRWSQEGSPGV